MRLFSFPFFVGRLFFALILLATTATGYSLLAALPLLPFFVSSPAFCLPLIAVCAAIGCHFAAQSAGHLLSTESEPLSQKGYELYPQQRASTLFLCSALGWLLLLWFTLPTKDLPILSGGSLLIALAQWQLAQILCHGQAFELLACQEEQLESQNFSFKRFMHQNILCYASKDYRNAQATLLFIALIVPLYSCPLSASLDWPWLLLQHYSFSWAWGAQWLIGLFVVLPALGYTWVYHPWLVAARKRLDWLAPSLLAAMLLSACGALGYHFLSKKPVQILMALESFIGPWGGLLTCSVTAIAFAAVMSQKLLLPCRYEKVAVDEALPAASPELFRDLKEQAHLLL